MENYLCNYVFLKSVVLWPYNIWLYMKMHHNWYCIWGNAWIVSMEKYKHCWFNPLMMDFRKLLHCLQFLKMLYLDLIWEVIQNLFDKKWFWRLWKPCEYLRYSNILWNYLEFQIKCNLWVLYVSLMLWHVITWWLLS